jgi:hypothetical protein
LHGWPCSIVSGEETATRLNHCHAALQKRAATNPERVMLISFISSLFARRGAFRWQPAIEVRDSAAAVALGIYSRR